MTWKPKAIFILTTLVCTLILRTADTGNIVATIGDVGAGIVLIIGVGLSLLLMEK